MSVSRSANWAAARSGRRGRGSARPRPMPAGSRSGRGPERDTSPSMPTTSVTCVTRRVPSRRRVRCTMRSSGGGHLLADGPRRQVDAGHQHHGLEPASASRGVLACTVDSEPSWPVFIAWSMSSASAPRTSPTMMRSGRMRSALRTRSRIVTWPRPSMLGGRLSRRTTWRWCSCSSTASSMVTMRSSSGMNDETAR